MSRRLHDAAPLPIAPHSVEDVVESPIRLCLPKMPPIGRSRERHAQRQHASIDLADLSQIPAETLLLLTVNDDSARYRRDAHLPTAGPR
jgi:hypothetical protein